MARWIGEDADIAVIGQRSGAEGDGLTLGHVDVGRQEAEVELLRDDLAGPIGRPVAFNALER